MPRRSQSPRRDSPPRRYRRSPEPDRRRRETDRDEKYSRGSRHSRDDRDGRDYDRDRRRPRDDDRRERRDDRDSRRREDNDYDRNPRGRQREEPEPAPSHSRPKTGSPSRSRSGSPVEDKAKPNFGNSGLLAADTNTVKHGDGTSTLLKYNEPPEARKPLLNWRLYVFKGQEQVDLLHIHRQSAYLIGRDQIVCDIPVEHPSCSKQHAAIQFRQVQVKDEYGVPKPFVKPFVIDLESTNGTVVNDEIIPASRYYELKSSDVLKFGQSTREYVLLPEETS